MLMFGFVYLSSYQPPFSLLNTHCLTLVTFYFLNIKMIRLLFKISLCIMEANWFLTSPNQAHDVMVLEYSEAVPLRISLFANRLPLATA